MSNGEPTIVSVSVRQSTNADKHLEAYDNTKLQALNTCITWGVLRYQMHKKFATNARAMALEAGSAHHEVYAAVRLWQLWKYDAPGSEELFMFHGERLFGEENFALMMGVVNEAEDERTQCLNFCLQALYNSGFYDDPSDKRRTMSNLEEAAIMYIDRWDFTRHPLWIRDRDDPHSDVGIEIAFDTVITFRLSDDTVKEYRFTGILDGLHYRDGPVVVGENKTASRLDAAWTASFEMSSQVTGYMLAAGTFVGEPVNKGIVWGVQIPQPRSGDISGFTREYPTRESFHFARWFNWFYHTVQLYERYQNDPINAPKYTHSCNRYFRPCAFIPFCVADDEEQERILDEMVIEEWSPLHRGVENSGD